MTVPGTDALLAPGGAEARVSSGVGGAAAGIVRAIDRGIGAAALAGGVLILAAGALICVEVLLRKVFNTSTGIAEEMSGYALAIGSAYAFPYCLRERCHIRIDTIYVLLGVRLKLLLDVVALLAMITFFGIVVFFAADTTAMSWRVGTRAVTPLLTPLAWPQFFWLTGLALFVASLIYTLALGVLALARGRAGDAAELIGASSGRPD